MVIIGGGIRDVAGKTCHRLQQVGARYDADDAIPAHHRQTLDVILFHQCHDFLERGILGDGERLRRHDLGYLAALLANEIGRSLARTEDECQETAAFALGAELAAAHEIAFRDNADELSLAASTTGRPLTCRCSMVFAASTIVVSGVTVVTGLVMIWWARMGISAGSPSRVLYQGIPAAAATV